MAEQISSFEGSSTPKVQQPDASFSGDSELIKTFQSVLPKYQGVNPYTLKSRLINDQEAYKEFSQDYWTATETSELRALEKENPEQYQAVRKNFNKNLWKDINSSSYAGEAEKDTLINRTVSLNQTIDDLPVDTYKSLVKNNPDTFQEFDLLDDNKNFVYKDTPNERMAFAQQVMGNPDLHKKLVGERYNEYQDALTNSFNNANLIDDLGKKTQSWVVFNNFGSEGLTQYINGLQGQNLDADVMEQTTSRDKARNYFSQAKINDRTAFDLIDAFVTGGEEGEPLTFRPVTPRADITVDVPADSNPYTNLFYKLTDEGKFETKDTKKISESFLKEFAPENYHKFLNVDNIDKDGPYASEYGKLSYSVFDTAINTNQFSVEDLQDTVKAYGEYVGSDKDPRYRFNYDEAPARVKIAIDALNYDDESSYMFEYKGDGVYDFRPKRRQAAQSNLNFIKNLFFATKDELYEDENGEIQARRVADNSGFKGIANTLATTYLMGLDTVVRYGVEPIVRVAGELSQHEGTKAFASYLKDYTGVDLATGLSQETDGMVPNAIGEVAPFIQYMGAMFGAGGLAVKGGAKALSLLTNSKKAFDLGRYAKGMMGSTRLKAMSRNLDAAVGNKAPWLTGAKFYTGGAVIEASQPEEVSFLNQVPKLLGYGPTNSVTEFYKTSSDATKVALDAGASLILDGFFDTLIAGSKFATAKAGQRYKGRTDFKGIKYSEKKAADGEKFGGFEVVDEPMFRHELREFWGNFTSDLDKYPIGDVGQSMAKNMTKGVRYKTLHDFTRSFVDDSEYVMANVRGDIEDNVRFLKKTLGDGVEVNDADISKIVDQQYENFIDNVSNQMYGYLRDASSELPMRVAQTLDEQVPTMRRLEVNGRPAKPAEVNDYPNKNLIVKGNEVYEVEPNFWTIDLANSLRKKSIEETKEAVVTRKKDAYGSDLNDEIIDEINARAENVGKVVEVNGKGGYVEDFDNTSYMIRTVDNELNRIKDVDLEPQLRKVDEQSVDSPPVQQTEGVPFRAEQPDELQVGQVTPKGQLSIKFDEDTAEQYAKRLNDTAKAIGKTTQKQLRLNFC